MGLDPFLATFDPLKVVVYFNNSLISNFGKDSMIKAKRNSDSFALSIGADGFGARTAIADKSGEVEITLLQTSASNDLLSASLANDELTKLGVGVLAVVDASGRTLLQSNSSWVKKPADVELAAADVTDRVWTIACQRLDMFVGGN